jgi:hypothetical protein
MEFMNTSGIAVGKPLARDIDFTHPVTTCAAIEIAKESTLFCMCSLFNSA